LSKTLYRTRVYEEQWGGTVMPYVTYFESEEQAKEFAEETGYRVELIEIVEM